MFERRLKILLLLLFVLTIGVALRAVQIQVIERTYWQDLASKTMKRSTLIDTVRGRIVDYRGREIAIDAACIDACVDYRAIPREPDPLWIRDLALSRLRANMAEEYRKLAREQRAQLLDDEIARVRTDLEILWATLAKLSNQTVDQIDEVRDSIVRRVEMRRRYVWYNNYAQAVARHETRDAGGNGPAAGSWYRQWLIDDNGDAPQLDSFAIDVAEQREPHVILRAIDTNTHNYLAKNIDKFPGLVLRPSTHRVYPYAEAGCHLIGHLSRVAKEDLANDPSPNDELRAYLPNDLIGRGGLEGLCEPILRGTRGRVERIVGEDAIVGATDAKEGGVSRTTIDIELQSHIQSLFKHATIGSKSDDTEEQCEMHGAAVVIDVASGEVRALVSNPTFDPNELDERYAEWNADKINQPLMNRATQAQLEPGSTVKPMVGLGAITQGVVRVDEGIECTGFLVLNGKRYSVGRCWTESRFHMGHHSVPSQAPHPTGFLTYADAIERSCNVYFETMGDRLGIDGLSTWMDRFGLGRETGIGILEFKGRLPRSFKGPSYLRRMTSWFAGIGQGQVAATPIQMANVAATIARNGVWMRPRLVPASVLPSSRPSADRIDLHLAPEALAAAKLGMINVVNARAGTGTGLQRSDVTIAGKTGTAQAAKFSLIVRDAEGREVRDGDGNVVRRFLEPATKAHPTDTPWYRGMGASGSDLAHAWYIGFAPAQNPTIAFCVLVEYGGSGGMTAAPIARDVLEACVEHGYLSLEKK